LGGGVWHAASASASATSASRACSPFPTPAWPRFYEPARRAAAAAVCA
jgi:hypothetical protein